MRTFLTTVLLGGMLLLAFTSCSDEKTKSASDKKEEGTFDMAAARKAIDDANQNLVTSMKKGDSTAFAGVYSSDAKIMAPGGPAITGKDALASMAGGMIRTGYNGLSLKTVDVWGNDALLGEEGTYTLSMSDGKEADHGKYIALWKKEDGKWKLFRDIWNSDMATAPAK